MQPKRYFSLQPSEGILIRAAADIYSAYIPNGQVPDGKENAYIQKSIQEAMTIADSVENLIQSDGEMG